MSAAVQYRVTVTRMLRFCCSVVIEEAGPQMLVADDTSYRIVEREEASQLFNVIPNLYKQDGTILTSLT